MEAEPWPESCHLRSSSVPMDSAYLTSVGLNTSTKCMPGANPQTLREVIERTEASSRSRLAKQSSGFEGLSSKSEPNRCCLRQVSTYDWLAYIPKLTCISPIRTELDSTGRAKKRKAHGLPLPFLLAQSYRSLPLSEAVVPFAASPAALAVSFDA